jgi:plastocyanin
MRRSWVSIRSSVLCCCVLLVPLLIATQAASVAAQTQASAGAASTDQGRQALAFLPNELWIHTGDSITWTFPTDEIHTVTFLRTNPSPQIRPPFSIGCPGTTPSGSSYAGGAACLNSGTLLGGATYTVQFPTTGNFKLVCLVHANMTGVVHVLDVSETLPHDQAFYDRQAQTEQAELLSDASALAGRGHATARRTSENEVTAGIGEIVATTGGGSHTVSVMRFLQRKIIVSVGDTVEWTNLDPVTNHTVTFGVEPSDPTSPPSANVTTDSDGAMHALLVSSGDSVHSGLLGAARQDRVNLAQTPLGVTRFRVTFTIPGTFDYICALHDDLGMVGTVVVQP